MALRGPAAPAIVTAGIAGRAALGRGIGYYVGRVVDWAISPEGTASSCPMARHEPDQKSHICRKALVLAQASKRSICDVLAEIEKEARSKRDSAELLLVITAQKAAGCRNIGKRK